MTGGWVRCRGIPRLLIEVQAHEPAPGHVAVQFHRELAVAGHAEEIAARQGQEQLRGWNGGRPMGE